MLKPAANSSSARAAFTLIELLVVVAIIALLIAILLPSLARARYQAVKAQCASNLHHLGLGLNYYTTEYGEYPMVFNWGYTPPAMHPLHYPGQQSGLLALEQQEKFRRDYLRCPTGWASKNRGNNWYTNNNDNDTGTATGSANMDYIYWGQRFKPTNSFSITFASFRYQYKSNEPIKIIITDTVQELTGVTVAPQIANRFYGNHNDGPRITQNHTDGRGNTLSTTMELVARGGKVLFSDNHVDWFDVRKFRAESSDCAYPAPDQW